MLSGKLIIINLVNGQIRKTFSQIVYKMSQFFPKPSERYDRNVNVELDIYVIMQQNLTQKNVAGVDTSDFYKRSFVA